LLAESKQHVEELRRQLECPAYSAVLSTRHNAPQLFFYVDAREGELPPSLATHPQKQLQKQPKKAWSFTQQTGQIPQPLSGVGVSRSDTARQSKDPCKPHPCATGIRPRDFANKQLSLSW
jgi:hypothetical protein